MGQKKLISLLFFGSCLRPPQPSPCPLLSSSGFTGMELTPAPSPYAAVPLFPNTWERDRREAPTENFRPSSRHPFLSLVTFFSPQILQRKAVPDLFCGFPCQPPPILMEESGRVCEKGCFFNWELGKSSPLFFPRPG